MLEWELEVILKSLSGVLVLLLSSQPIGNVEKIACVMPRKISADLH